MGTRSKTLPEKAAIQRVARSALQSKSVTVERLGGYLYQTYRLRTSSGFFYVLRCQPPNNVRLLRHEEERLEAEVGAHQLFKGRIEVSTARLIEYHNTKTAIGTHFLISGPYGGLILSEIEPSLSRQALAIIDSSLGRYVRNLSTITGPAFGCLRPSPSSPGQVSWARAFAGMLETVLRDAEDALISLPYEGMRDLVRRHRGSLDRVTTPRLVLLDLAADKNVVVDPKTYQVTGLLDFSTAMWGDVFVSDVFYNPRASFAEGFGKLPNGDAEERARQYLYVLYHSLLAIVRHSYRPSDDEDELEARRKLTAAMRHLSGGSR